MQDNPLWIGAFAAFIAVWLAGCIWHSKRVKAQQARDAAREQRARRWVCPNCGATYGMRSLYVAYGGDDPVFHCNLVCNECRHLNGFDREGNARFGRGELFTHDWQASAPVEKTKGEG